MLGFPKCHSEYTVPNLLKLQQETRGGLCQTRQAPPTFHARCIHLRRLPPLGSLTAQQKHKLIRWCLRPPEALTSLELQYTWSNLICWIAPQVRCSRTGHFCLRFYTYPKAPGRPNYGFIFVLIFLKPIKQCILSTVSTARTSGTLCRWKRYRICFWHLGNPCLSSCIRWMTITYCSLRDGGGDVLRGRISTSMAGTHRQPIRWAFNERLLCSLKISILLAILGPQWTMW